MKFVCERCQTKYSIADEKVRQKVLKIRCKTCENVVTIRDAVVVTEPSLVRSEPPPAPAQAPRSVEWHLAVGGHQSGPFGLAALVSRIVAANRGDEVYVWNEHLDGWKEPRLVPEVAAEMRLRAASIDPPVPPARRPITPVAGHSLPPRSGGNSPGSAVPRTGRSGAMAAVASALEPAMEDAFEEKTQISPLDASMMMGADAASRSQPGRTGFGQGVNGARPEARRPDTKTSEHPPTEPRRSDAKPVGSVDGKSDRKHDEKRDGKQKDKPSSSEIRGDSGKHGLGKAGDGKNVDGKHADKGMASLLSMLPATSGQAARKSTGASGAVTGFDGLDFSSALVAPSQPALDFPAAARSSGVPVAVPVAGGDTSMLLSQAGVKAVRPRHPAVKYGILGLLLVGLVGTMVLVASRGEEKPAPTAKTTLPPAAPGADPEAAARAAAEEYFKNMVGKAAAPSPVTKSVGPPPAPRRPNRARSPEPAAPVALAPPPVSGSVASGDGARLTQRFAAEERRVRVPAKERSGNGAADDFDISKFMAVFKQPDHYGAIKSCYERALKRDANLKLARLDINVTVGETGSAKKVRIDAPAEFNMVSSCIRNSVRRWRFPPNQREYEAAFPLILQGNSD